MYFHENQIAYPWPKHDPDKKLERDFHYYYINQTSALASNWSLFNSNYNKKSFQKQINVSIGQPVIYPDEKWNPNLKIQNQFKLQDSAKVKIFHSIANKKQRTKE